MRTVLAFIVTCTATAMGQVFLPPPMPQPPTFDSRPQGAAPIVQPPGVGAFSVVLKWAVPDCAISYIVERSDGMIWRSNETPPSGYCPGEVVNTRLGMAVRPVQGLPPEIFTYADNVRAQSSYQYMVRANYKDMKTGTSPSIAVTTPPPSNPGNFTASYDPAGNVTLRWDPVSSASSYVLREGAAPPQFVSGNTMTLPAMASGPHAWSLLANHNTWYGPVTNTATPSRTALMVVGPVAWQSPTTLGDQTLCNPPQTVPGPTPGWSMDYAGIAGSTTWPVVGGAVAYVVERSVFGGNNWTFAGSTCGGPSRFNIRPTNVVNDPNTLGYVEFTDYSGGIVPNSNYVFRIKSIGAAGQTGTITTQGWRAAVPPTPFVVPPQIRLVSGSGYFYPATFNDGQYIFQQLPKGEIDTLHLQWTSGSSASAPMSPTQYRITTDAGFSQTQPPGVGGMQSLRLYGVARVTATYTITSEWVAGGSQPPLIYASTSSTFKLAIPP